MAIVIPTDWQDRGSQFYSPSTKSTKGKAGSYCEVQCVQVDGDCTNQNFVTGSMALSVNASGPDCSLIPQATYSVRYRILSSEFTAASLATLATAINADVFAAGNPCAAP